MTPTFTLRRGLVTAAILAPATLAVAVLMTPAFAGESRAPAAVHAHAVVEQRALNARQVAFHDQMRRLWEDHVTWTRLAIVTFADGSAGFDASAGRLLQNQADIGNAVKPFFGARAGDRLTSLLHDHITIAVELLQAAKAGDGAAAADASARWYANANDIADLLASANPRFWPQTTMRAAMKAHLDQTLAEAQDELTGNFGASVSDYEAIHTHILEMADLLSSGIMRAFPQSFH